MEGMEIEYLAQEIKISQEEMRKVLGQAYSEKEKYKYLLCRCYHRFAIFFKIGFGYDWEKQYKEYKKFWENYFYSKQAGKGGLKKERMAV